MNTVQLDFIVEKRRADDIEYEYKNPLIRGVPNELKRIAFYIIDKSLEENFRQLATWHVLMSNPFSNPTSKTGFSEETEKEIMKYREQFVYWYSYKASNN